MNAWRLRSLMPSKPLNHPRVHCDAGSRKYYGDFMAPSKSRVWMTIQPPTHTAHKHIPPQIYLWNNQKPPTMCKKPFIRRVATRPEWKSFSKAGVVHTVPGWRARRAAAPRPLPADNGAAGKGYRKNNMRNTSWLKICAAPGEHIQRINTTSSYPLG